MPDSNTDCPHCAQAAQVFRSTTSPPPNPALSPLDASICQLPDLLTQVGHIQDPHRFFPSPQIPCVGGLDRD